MRWWPFATGRREPKDITTNYYPDRVSWKLTSLLQIFCPGCDEFDKRCSSRLIWAPKVTLSHVRQTAPAVTLHQNFRELELCAEKGCYSCRLWRRSLLRECHSEETISSLQKSSHPVLAFPPSSTIRPWIITIETTTSDGELLRGRLLLENATFVRTPSKSYIL
jgi:hypothetical protein